MDDPYELPFSDLEARVRSTRDPLTPAERQFAQELFERHRLSLQRYLRSMLPTRDEASEILQETYLRLLRQRTFEHMRANARAYLFQIATNLARDHFRQRTFRNATVPTEPLDDAIAPDWSSWPDLAAEGEEIAAAIVHALETLHPAVREALLLHRFRDLTHHEIANLMRVSTRTIERYVSEGIAHIARHLKDLS